MPKPDLPTAAVHHETATVEEATVEGLIRYAHRVLHGAGHVLSPSKVSKTARKAFREVGPSMARSLIDNWARDLSRSAEFNPDVTLKLTYADRTGDTAARNVDFTRAKKKAPASTGAKPNETAK